MRKDIRKEIKTEEHDITRAFEHSKIQLPEHESLLSRVERKDKKAVKEWEERAKKSEVMRIM